MMCDGRLGMLALSKLECQNYQMVSDPLQDSFTLEDKPSSHKGGSGYLGVQ